MLMAKDLVIQIYCVSLTLKGSFNQKILCARYNEKLIIESKRVELS
jgi:hypothetical protein